MTPIVCPRTWAENGDAAVPATATAVRMIYHSRHTHEKAKKHTAVDCDTDRAPANMGRKRSCSSDCYSSTYDILQQTHTRRQKNTPRSIVTPIVCPRTWAENGDAAATATATAVRMIYYSRHAHEEKAKKHTAVDCDTDRVPCLLYTSPSPRD